MESRRTKPTTYKYRSGGLIFNIYSGKDVDVKYDGQRLDKGIYVNETYCSSIV